MRHLLGAVRYIRAANRVEIHEARRAHGVVGLGDWQQTFLASVSRNDGLVNAVGGILAILDPQQQLRERVVFQYQALAHPAACDVEQVGEQPRLGVLLLVAEIVFQNPLG
jgi:hypothetical protein